MQDYLRRLSFAVLELKSAVIADIAVAVVQVGLLATVALWARITPTVAYAVLALASLAGILSWRAASRVRFHFSSKDAAVDLRLALRTGKWILISGVLWTLGMNLYPWLLASFRGTAATATWAACFAAAAFAGPVITGIGNVVGPRLSLALATGGTRALRRATLSSTYLLGGAMLPFVIGAALFGSRVVALAYGDKYAGSGAVVLLLIGNSFFTAVGLPYSRALFAIERAELDVLANLIALAVTLSAGIWHVRSFGVTGAALGLAVGGLGACAARVLLFMRFVRTTAAAV
jgi:O-antigen/teichoic acid export membrane protein